MTARPFGPQAQVGLRTPLVAEIGQGSWRLEQATEAAAIAALRKGLDLGLTHIDTAEMYGSGAAEHLIGKAIVGCREQVFLVSKVLPSNASLRGTIAACEASLKRLATDYLDCYLLHWRGSFPLTDTIAAFDRLQRDGKIRSWGVSNFDAADLDEVEAIAGPGHPACNQVLYHLRERAIEHAVIPWCEQRGTAVVAYTPFGQSDAAYSRKSAGGRVLQTIATAHGATPRQVALRFLLRHRTSFAIPKAVHPDHIAENAGALRLNLTDEDIATIDAAFPLGAEPRALPMI